MTITDHYLRVGAPGPGHTAVPADRTDDALDAARGGETVPGSVPDCGNYGTTDGSRVPGTFREPTDQRRYAGGGTEPQAEPPGTTGSGTLPGNREPDADYGGPRLWRATDLAASRKVAWLARGRIPKGAVTYMLGPEGIGKSLFTVWLAAAVTRGEPVPQFGMPARSPGTVVLILTEDDWATVARPRLELAGADLERVRLLCADRDGTGTPVFPTHIDRVADDDDPPALVIVDAWADTLPTGMAVKDPQQARQALHPWKELAGRTGAAIVLCGHTNRQPTGQVRNAYGLTGELRKKARATLLAQPDEDDDTAMIIGPEKNNLTGPVAASRFRKETVPVFEASDDSDGTIPCLVWAGEAEQSARDYFADAADGDDRDDRTDCEVWLQDYLEACGTAPRAGVLQAAEKARAGSPATVKRAAKRLGVVSEYQGFPRAAHWSLPLSAQSDHKAPHVFFSEPTEPTGTALGKRNGLSEPTGSLSAQSAQVAHGSTHGSAGDPTGAAGGCDVCGKPVMAGQGERHLGCGGGR